MQYESNSVFIAFVKSFLLSKENISKYELKGFIEGVLQTMELKKINAIDISFDKKDYSNLLMKTLFEYRLDNGISFDENIINEDLEKILDIIHSYTI